jgi:hypothetical protein
LNPGYSPALRPSSEDLISGGSELINAFFVEALQLRSPRTWILVPYVERSALEDATLRHSWNRLAVVGDLRIVVRSRTAAEAVQSSMANPARVDVRIAPTLHAKLFVSTSPTGCVTLVGSSNLTSAALHINLEAGVLIRGTRAPALRRVVANFRAQAEHIARCASSWRGTR